MKKTVKTAQGHVINFTIRNADGTPIGEDGLKRLEKTLLKAIADKAEPAEDELRVRWPNVA